jgi:Ulp1 family protease
MQQSSFGSRLCPQQPEGSNDCGLYTAWFVTTLLTGNQVSGNTQDTLPASYQRRS